MDCNSALAKLELSQFGDCAHDDPELASAAAHLADCERCRTIVAHREEMDHSIAAVCRDVPIPPGLEDRLLTAVHTELAAKPIPPDDRPLRSTRKRHLIRRTSAVAAALVLLVAVGWYWIRLSSVSVTSLTLAAAQRLESQTGGPLFEGAFDPAQQMSAAFRFPASMRMDAYRELFPERPELDIAVSEFEFRSNGGRTVRGALIMAPVGTISPRPAATSLASAIPVYHSRFSAVSWHDGVFVYVCLVSGGDGPLRELQHQAGTQTT